MNNTAFLGKFGERVRQKRIELGMSQDELAHKIGYRNRVSVFHIENGTQNISSSKALLLASALETDIDWLMDGDEPEDDFDAVIDRMSTDCSKDRLLAYAIRLMEAAKEK